MTPGQWRQGLNACAGMQSWKRLSGMQYWKGHVLPDILIFQTGCCLFDSWPVAAGVKCFCGNAKLKKAYGYAILEKRFCLFDSWPAAVGAKCFWEKKVLTDILILETGFYLFDSWPAVAEVKGFGGYALLGMAFIAWYPDY